MKILFVVALVLLTMSDCQIQHPHTRNQQPAFYYVYKPQESMQSFYPPDHDFTDYSQHFTRTVQLLQKNSGGALNPVQPYSIDEIKSNSLSDFETNYLNRLDKSEYSQRPAATVQAVKKHTALQDFQYYPGPNHIQQSPQLHRRPGKRRRVKKRPVNQRPNIDKISVVQPSHQSPAFPGATLSLLAGLAWLFISKTATPVVRMRSSDSPADGEQRLLSQVTWSDKWEMFQSKECRQLAVCEMISKNPTLSESVVNELQATEEQKSFSVFPALSWLKTYNQAALDGASGANCASLYSNCTVWFASENEGRDR